VENQGQTDARVRFESTGPGHGFYFTPRGVTLSLQKPSGDGVALDLRFLGARRVAPVGGTPAAGTFNYLRGGDSRTGVRGYTDVVYRDLWPGIDMTVAGRDGRLKYEFRVHPGASPHDIALAYRGAERLRRDASGGLRIDTPIGPLQDAAPVATQDGRPVPVRYALSNARAYGFDVGAYDHARDLVIDPAIAYASFLGGAADDQPTAIAVVGAGNASVTGYTQSPDFPTTAGAFKRSGSASNSLDAFVAKIYPSGTGLVYSTFIGGTNFDWGRAIAVDSAGNAYVAGQTQSPSFPTTGGAFDRTFNVDSCPRCGIDQYDGFVLKLNATGSALSYSTFLGGTQIDDVLGLALDGARNAYVTGETASSNFPVTSGAFDRTPNGGYDGFVSKLNSTGSALVYSSLLGGESTDTPDGIAVDAAGDAVVAGSTRSPTFASATNHGGSDAFVATLNPAGSDLVSSTLVGDTGNDSASDLSLDAAGDVYLVGSRQSGGFALKLEGSQVAYETSVPGNARAVVADADGGVWIAGSAGAGTFTSPDAFQPFFRGGGSDAYLSHLDPTGTAVTFASFLGGLQSEFASAVALDGAGNPYLTGRTSSPDFPISASAFDRTYGGDPLVFWGEGWVAKVDANEAAPPVTPPAPAPAAPALTGATANPVTFDWEDVAGATSYELQVDDLSSFGLPHVFDGTSTVSQLAAGTLPDGTWFWRVRAINAEGTPGEWSETRTLTLQETPPPPLDVPLAPSLISPTGSATQPFSFDWSDVDGAAWYTIEVRDAAGTLVWAATSTPSELLTNSLPTGTLSWRVRAFNADGVGGPFSATGTVVVGAVLTAPSLLSPSSDARLKPGTVAFDWTDVSGAASYTIQVDDSDTFSSPLIDQAVPSSSFSTSSLPAKRLWWRVRADDGGPWSGARRFEIKS
jgi:hypothetical protein